MKRENQVKLFGAIVFYFFVLNLFSFNAIIPADFFHNILGLIPVTSDLPENSYLGINLFDLIFQGSFEGDLFLKRLPGVLAAIIGCLSIYFFGKKILGIKTISFTLLILVSNFHLPMLVKSISSDIWLFLLHSISTIFLIIFLKQPAQKWHISYTILLIFSGLLAPISTAGFNLILWVLLYFLHPKGNNLKNCWGLVIGLSIPIILYLTGIFSFDFKDSTLFLISLNNLSIWKYLLLIIGLSLPWTIFLPSAIWHLIKRFRKKEELAIITFSWFVASLISLSPAIHLLFSILIAKQLFGFFEKNYPYENQVKSFALLHLGTALFAAIYWMIIWWDAFKGDGFRPAMFTSFIYWSGCLLAFLGLYGKHQKPIILGMASAGLLGTYLFWSQVFPLL